jgi:hypothetical protein
MKKSLQIFFCISVIFSSCHDYNYSKGVHRDAERLFKSHKEFFKSLSFGGVISGKKYCEKCQLNKYQIIIDLKEKKPEIIELGNLSYQPYYFFTIKNQLTISVTQHLYESLEKGFLLEKKMDSDSLIWENQQYILLSKEQSQWLPD